MGVKGEATAWAFTQHPRSCTHPTRDFNCEDRSPFAAGGSSEPTSAPSDSSPPTHPHSPVGAPSSRRRVPRFPEAESPTQREWYSGIGQLKPGVSDRCGYLIFHRMPLLGASLHVAKCKFSIIHRLWPKALASLSINGIEWISFDLGSDYTMGFV